MDVVVLGGLGRSATSEVKKKSAAWLAIFTSRKPMSTGPTPVFFAARDVPQLERVKLWVRDKKRERIPDLNLEVRPEPRA